MVSTTVAGSVALSRLLPSASEPRTSARTCPGSCPSSSRACHRCSSWSLPTSSLSLVSLKLLSLNFLLTCLLPCSSMAHGQRSLRGGPRYARLPSTPKGVHVLTLSSRLDFLIKYHGNNNPESKLVALEYAEFVEGIALDACVFDSFDLASRSGLNLSRSLSFSVPTSDGGTTALSSTPPTAAGGCPVFSS